MTHSHVQVRCNECDTVIRQCRCMSSNKVTSYETCEECKIAVFNAIVPDTKQQLREALAREVYLRSQLAQLSKQIKELEKNNER